MKNSTLQIKYDADKLAALKQYAERKQVSIDDEIAEALTKLYEKYVPAAVREFIDFSTQNAESVPKQRNTAQSASAVSDRTADRTPSQPVGNAAQNNHTSPNS